MRAILALAAAALFLAAPLSAGVGAPAPQVVPLPPEFARLDPDGGRTLLLTVDDGEGGEWREFPVTDAGLAAFTNVLASNGVAVDPIAYGAELREIGAFAHAWQLEGAPYVTLGVYVVTSTQGKVRVPTLIVENVTDLGAMMDLVASVVADDALPVAAETFPHAYALASPDGALGLALQALAEVLVSGLLLSAVDTLASADAGSPGYNLPPEAYDATRDVALALTALGYPLAMAQFGIGGTYGQADGSPAPEPALTHDWTDRPEVRVWAARKVAAGHDVWTGIALSRTGDAEGDGVHEFHSWKRLGIGPATRIDGVVSSPAGVFVRADVDRHYQDEDGTGGESHIANTMEITVGAYAQGADTPLTRARMDETRDDTVDEGNSPFQYAGENAYGVGDGQATYLPEERSALWSAGVVVGDEYVPLVGARTDAWTRAHWDVTNLREPIFEWESERLASAGVFVGGAYTPVAGARTWIERSPLEFFALALAGEGPGSQRVGDLEASVGTFALGAYVPLAGSRYDDDFAEHKHAMRAMVSAGTYVDGAFSPLLGVTYDGEQTLSSWAVGHPADSHDGATRWQSSVGTFTLGFYRPLLGTRYVPATHAETGVKQESYQIGVYPLYYDPFIPVASVDYGGDGTSAWWAESLTWDGAEDARVDLVAYTPGPYAFPLAGARYTNEAPDMTDPHSFHVALGAYGPDGAFVPVAGVSYGSSVGPTGLALSLAQQALGGARHEEATVSVGVYDPQTGAYTAITTADTALSPV